MVSTPTPDKKALRAALRARRKSVDRLERRRAARQLVRWALHHRLLARGKWLGFYLPAKAEVDVTPLLIRAMAMGARCFLPVVPGRGRRKLWFSQYGARAEWVLNRYGIPENRHPLATTLRASRLQTLFTPLLGFDARGYRIGMGGGYYDATLAHLRQSSRWRRPRVIGVAFSLQEVEWAPNDPWDVPLDGVLTERGYRRFTAPQ